MRLTTFCLSAALLLGAVVLAGADARAARSAGSGEPLESKGPVRIVIAEGEGAAFAVLWPPIREIEAGTPPGTAFATASLIARRVSESVPGARPWVAASADGLEVGVSVPEGTAADDVALMALRVAVPLDGDVRGRRDELAALIAELDEQASPSRRARGVAMGLAAGGRGVGPAALGGRASRERIRLADVQLVAERARGRARAVRVIGDAELGAKVEERLDLRETPPASRLEATIPTKARLAFAVRPHADDEERVGIAHVYVAPYDVARDSDGAFSLLVEAMRNGEGSLTQRASVKFEDDDVTTSIEEFALDGAVAVMLSGEAPASQAARLQRLLSGVAASIAELPLREDALARARKRLDEAVTESAGARAILEARARPSLAKWPPDERWNRPPRALDVRELAAEILDPSRRLTVVAGAAPRPFDEWLDTVPHVYSGWSAEGLESRTSIGDLLDVLPRPLSAEVRELATSIADALGVVDPLGGGPVGFRATWSVIESTPVGEARSELVVESADSTRWSSYTVDDESLVVQTGPSVEEVVLPGLAQESAEIVAPSRAAAMELFQPLVLLRRVLRGELTARAVGESTLEIDLPGGGRARLEVDPRSRRPSELEIWWYRSSGDDPDETVRYAEFGESEGGDVVRRATIADRLGTVRRLVLEDWSRTEPAEPSAPR